MQRNFLRGLLLCLIPTVLFGAVVVFGTYRLGIDLAGGTILVYEVDLSKRKSAQQPGAASAADDEESRQLSNEEMQRLADSLKKRIDPVDTKNIIIRPVSGSRIEILVPFTPSSKKAAGDEDFVQFVKDVVSRVGRLEFRILANEVDDADGIREAQERLNSWSPEDREKSAKLGTSPPVVDRANYSVQINGIAADKVQYEWIELGREERDSLSLNNDPEQRKSQSGLWDILATQRDKPYLHRTRGGKDDRESVSMLLFSREFKKENPTQDEKDKKIEYYVLTRVSEQDRVEVGGDVTLNATADNHQGNWKVAFRLNSAGASKFGSMTSRNRPTTGAAIRSLAILLDNKIMSAPTVNSEIRDQGEISGNFTKDTVDRLVYILRSGALTAELKPNPVSENSVGATLGEDTKRKGLFAVGIAFGAVMAFMVVYYRFAGVVACIALLINLLLTVGFMVSVNAAFTLAGLAGIVLMLGMAVDANVLIYERLREEREKGATLAAAIRAGYDRAFPTIIDTHLSSIFTAIVLFVFGNDNLKGFAVSLTVGLVISLFTSLYITRLIFDYWQSKRWLRELKMMKLFSKQNINFMGIRRQMFALTAFLTVAGLAIFLLRGDAGLNVDFRGGTVYGGRLAEPRPLVGTSEKPGILDLLTEAMQEKKLKVKDAREANPQTNTWEIEYEGDTKPTLVSFANKPADKQEVLRRASKLPDVSVEQVKVSALGDDNLSASESKSFTIRTTEKEKELVQVMLDRLLRQESGQPLLDMPKLEGRELKDTTVKLTFSKPASVSYIKTLLARTFQQFNRVPQAGSAFTLTPVYSAQGSEDQKQEAATGKYKGMTLDLATNSEFGNLREALENYKKVGADPVAAVLGGGPSAVKDDPKATEERTALNNILSDLESTVQSRPVPDRLETFDAALAKETQSRALFAIVASWIAILLYLWFRFGSWTFGLAAVFCLIHDLCFTLGCIALCHYLHAVPAFGTLFQIQDFKIDLAAVAALLTLVGYSVNDTIVVFDRIREVRGKNPLLTEQMINDSVNQTLSRTVLASLTVFLVVGVLYWFGGDGVHLFAFVMVVGVIVGTYSSIYIASPLLLMFGEGKVKADAPAEAAPGVFAKV